MMCAYVGTEISDEEEEKDEGDEHLQPLLSDSAKDKEQVFA